MLPLRTFKKRKHSLDKEIHTCTPNLQDLSLAIWFISAESANSFWRFTACMWQGTNAQMKHKSIAGSLALFFQNAASHCFSKDTPWDANKSLLTTDAFALWTACTKWWLYENFILIPSSVYFSYCKMDHSVLGGGFSRTYDPQFLLCLNVTFTLETCCTHSFP